MSFGFVEALFRSLDAVLLFIVEVLTVVQVETEYTSWGVALHRRNRRLYFTQFLLDRLQACVLHGSRGCL